MRRIGAVGVLWNKASDAWLGMEDFRSPIRNQVFQELEAAEEIYPLEVDGLSDRLYCLAEDRPLLRLAGAEHKWRERTEFLAPLDCFLWDRRLIKALFGFDYKWEIYTPAAQRKFGPYTLPILSGEKLVGRIQMNCDSRSSTLYIERVWLEPGIRKTKKLIGKIEQAWKRLARLHQCSEIVVSPGIFLIV